MRVATITAVQGKMKRRLTSEEKKYLHVRLNVKQKNSINDMRKMGLDGRVTAYSNSLIYSDMITLLYSK